MPQGYKDTSFNRDTGRRTEIRDADYVIRGSIEVTGDLTKNGTAVGAAANTGTLGSLLLSSTEVNLNEGTAAKQPLYTCPSNRLCVVTSLILHTGSAPVDAAHYQIGWNADADNVLPTVDSALTAIPLDTALNTSIPDAGDTVNLMGYYVYVGEAGEVLGLKVTTPQGSTLTARVDVFGYLTDTSGVPVANVLVP